MKRARRTRPLSVLAAAVLLLCAADIAPLSAESMRGAEPAPDSGGGRSILLSVKIHGAKQRGRKVSFYKSVARQRKARGAVAATRRGAGEPEGNRKAIGGPSSPSGR